MRFCQMAISCLLTSIAFYTLHCGSMRALVPTRNSSAYLYVAKLRCRPTADYRTALATVLKLFFALEASKVLRQLYICHIAFLFSAQPFLSVLPSGIQNKLVTKQTNFAQQQDDNCGSESDRICDYLI